MLETKDKNASVLKKKFFFRRPQKKRSSKKIIANDTFWTRSLAQKLINKAANWASEQELQFSSKKIEIKLFTHKRNPDLGSLSIHGSKLELSKEARLLGVTLDSKLSWKPHTKPNYAQSDYSVHTR